VDADQFETLRESLGKLKLSDAGTTVHMLVAFSYHMLMY
jgi:translation elongation factor EF-4